MRKELTVPAGRVAQEAEHLPTEERGTGAPAAPQRTGQHCRPPALSRGKSLEVSRHSAWAHGGSGEAELDHASPGHGQGGLQGFHSTWLAGRPRETPLEKLLTELRTRCT